MSDDARPAAMTADYADGYERRGRAMSTTLTATDREVLERISVHEPIHTHQILGNGRLNRAIVLEAIGNLTDAGLIGCSQRGWYVRGIGR